MRRDHDRGYRKRLESIGSLIFLVMILAVSIEQGQTGTNGLIASAIEDTEPRGTLEIDRQQQVEEYQTNDNRSLTVEKIKSASIQGWNQISSVMDKAMKYLERHN